VPGFDIQTLTRFNPTKYRCPECWTLHPTLGIALKFPYVDGELSLIDCPNCHQHIKLFRARDWERALRIPHAPEDIVSHAKTLAEIATTFRLRAEHFPPLAALYAALSRAHSFVHIVSWGISLEMVGALKAISHRVPVRAIVSGVTNEGVAHTASGYPMEAVNCDLRLLRDARGWRDLPHQKIVVVDGLLAFAGSSNLTTDGWRKAAKDLESIDVITDVDDVIDRHNRLFAALWPKTETKIPFDLWLPPVSYL
jgi:hypothetical protein